MEELWKPLIFNNQVFENYLVSNKGRIYNILLKKEMKVIYSKGFKIIRITMNFKTYTVLVHRVVAELFIDNPLKYKYVLFKDNNKSNCDVTNLFWSSSPNALTEEERLEKLRKRNVQKVVNRRKKIKEQAIRYKGSSCLICGYNRCIGALEFHHLNPNEKDFAIANMYTKNWEIIKSELDKCVLLCANCHREVETGFVSYDLEKLEKDRKNNIPR